jgi:Xaa-Pro aminopeptidase
VAADGRTFLVANAIEMPRLFGEELAGFSMTPLEYPWADDHAAPDTLSRLAKQVLGADARIGADWPLAGTVGVERDIARARVPLTPDEVERYRQLGRDVAQAFERACRALQPGLSEYEISWRAIQSAASVGAQTIVSLVAADDRLPRFRHPVPTRAAWRRTVLVAQVARRHGLCVSISRIVNAGAIDVALTERTHATCRVFGALLDATRPAARGADIFAAVAAAYSHEGYPGEERKHHQGGATGYRSREWIAFPSSGERVGAPQAFAWNPSITGTKVEDTALVTEDGVELITATGEWPAVPIPVRGRTLMAADVLTI